jgi:hypothetical protein
VVFFIPQGILQTIKLQQLSALVALLYLYFALLIPPLFSTFPKLSYKKLFLSIQPACIIGTFYFGSIHAYISFFQQLGGFAGLSFLSNNYLLAISFSATALILLSFLSIAMIFFTSIQNRYTKVVVLLLYIVGILILIHAMLLGTHFQNLSDWIPQIIFFAVSFLSILLANKLDIYLSQKFPSVPKFGFGMIVILSMLLVVFLQSLLPQQTLQPFNIHAQHIQLAQQAQQAVINTNLPPIPGLRGDRTRRFTVSFDHPEIVLATQDTPLSFRINDASSGNPVSFFEKIYEKPMHLIIVDKSLSYFSHIHPQQTDKGFSITTQLPKDGIYHLYTDFQPLGAIEQQFAFTLPVGDTKRVQSTNFSQDTKTTKTFGTYTVKLQAPPLKAEKLSLGQQEITFTLFDATTKNPIKTLKPYLSSFGHLVMINAKTYDYLHVHPTNLTSPKPNENGGPTVTFLPLGLNGSIKSGTYRVFAQFNPDNKLFTADFTVEVK